MNKKLFGIVIGVVAIIVSISVVLLLKKNADSFDSLFVSQNSCTPYNLFVTKEENDFSVKITWETKAKCLGFVQYGMNNKNLDKVGIDLVYGYRSQRHEVVLEKLLTKERYYFLVNSNNVAFGTNGRPLEFIIENL